MPRMRKKKKIQIPSLTPEERMARAWEIFKNAPETVRTPKQQKAYDRAKREERCKPVKELLKANIRQPRAHIVSGGLPSLGKR